MRQKIVPVGSEPIACGVVSYFGGPRGRFAHPETTGGWFSPLRIIIAVTWVFTSFGFLAKANCAGGTVGPDGSTVLDWGANRQYTSACYNDIVPLYSGRGLDQGIFPYAYSWAEGDITRYMEYPVLAGLFQGALAGLSRASYGLVDWAGVPPAGWYFALTALVLSVLWTLTIVMVCKLAGRRMWDTILVAASPIIIVHAFTNWDIPSIFFVVSALVVIRRQPRRWQLWSGILIGLGAALKLWPLFILGAYLVVAVRNSRLSAWFGVAGAAIGAWLAVNVPIALAYPAAWGEFYRLNSARSWEWTTIYAVISRNTGWDFSISALNTFSFVAFAVSCAIIAVVGWKLQREPRIAELIFLILAAFLIFNKVWSPQYSLWLVVPAVLALPHWRLLLSWMVTEMLLWPVLMWHMIGLDNKGLPHEFLDFMVLVRGGFIIAIAVMIICQMMGKIPDKVRAAHDGRDPLLGGFARS